MTDSGRQRADSGRPGPALVKCVVWDLDGTLWKGVLLEDPSVEVLDEAAEAVRTLDARGILQSIASRNDEATALARLRLAGLHEYFLAPQIGWGAKSESVGRIAAALNIGLDAVLFVDDDPFERAEVAAAHPSVRTADAAETARLTELAELTPARVTADGARRRLLYLADQRRTAAEESFAGPAQDFLASLAMRLTVRVAQPGDLARAQELTARTNQLNATGYTYSADELEAFRVSGDHWLLVAELSDRFGEYGLIGVMLVERDGPAWTLKLLLISCRVMSRGVGAVLLNRLISRARGAGAALSGEFVDTGRNRQMLVAYRFAGFEETPDGGVVAPGRVARLAYNGDEPPAVPGYLEIVSDL